jgi:2-polyprenyl-3-methyl-5-hydroxy-6-metoxy-1,4-benzoquinol methylase
VTVQDVIKEWDREDAPPHTTLGTDAYWDSAVVWGHVDWITDYFPPPKTMLDFGCGDGRVLGHLMDRGYEIEGYDTCQASLDRLVEHRPDAIVHNTLPDKQYDVVLLVAVLIHYDSVDGLEVAKQAWNLVKPGGSLYALVSYVWPEGTLAKLPDSTVRIERRYPSEVQVLRKRRGKTPKR